MAGLFAGGAMAQDSSKWEYTKGTDEFTDEVTHYLALTAEEASVRGKNVYMLLYCDDNKTSLLISSGGHILNETYDSDDIWEVDYRIDDLKANKLEVLSNNESFWPFPSSKDISLIKSMFNHDKLRMRFQTYDGKRETVTFKITGIETEIKPIREACGW